VFVTAGSLLGNATNTRSGFGRNLKDDITVSAPNGCGLDCDEIVDGSSHTADCTIT